MEQVAPVNESKGKPASSARPAAAWYQRGLAALAGAVVVVAGGGTLLAFAARQSWRLELTSHFRVQYFWALAAASIVLSLLRWRKLSVLAAALATINLVLIVPLYFGPAAREGVGKRLRAMSFNVHYLNENYGATIELIVNERPDVVLLLEVTPEWVEALKFLKTDYPYQHVMPIENGGGVALYSRHEIKDLSVHHLAEVGLPTIVARLATPDGPLTVMGTHPASPSSPRAFDFRNRQLKEVAELASDQSGPVILMGDLNTTSWSPYFQDLLTTSKLLDSRRGFGVEPSWPSLPTPLLRIPIDHCLVSPEVSVLNRRIGPAVGSDHRPLLVDFALPKP